MRRGCTWCGLALAGLAWLASWALPSNAAACSIALRTGPSGCSAGVDGAVIPANAALPWRWPHAPMIFRHLPDGGVEELALRLVDDLGDSTLQPLQSLQVGSAYSIVCHDCERSFEEHDTTAFFVGPPAELPTELGRVVVGAPVLDQLVVNGSCEEGFLAVRALVDVELSAQAEPWRALLRWNVLVDGEPFASGGAEMPAFDELLELPAVARRSQRVLFSHCRGEGPPGLAAGVHAVQMRARLPDGMQLTTPPVDVELRCDGLELGSGIPIVADVEQRELERSHDFAPQVRAVCEASGLPEPAMPLRRDGGTERVDLVQADRGCAATPRAPTHGGVAMLACALVVLVVRRRRAI